MKNKEDEIDSLIAELRTLVPPECGVSRCMMISVMNGNTSPEMVMVSWGGRLKDELALVHTKEEQKRVRQEWSDKTRAMAKAMCGVLRLRGFAAYVDGTAVYVTGRLR